MSSKLDKQQILQDVHDDVNRALQVNVVAGAATFSIDSEKVDDSAFTPATDTVLTIGAVCDNVATDSVDEGDVGAVRMSANRNLFTQLRDAAGNERGANVTASNELQVLASAQPGVDIGDVTINNAAGASAVNIQDGGNSITVDGAVTVSATDLDIRDLTSVSDSVSVLQATHDNLNLNANIQVGNVDVANGNPVPISDAGGSLTVDGTVSLGAGVASIGVLGANSGVDIGDVTINNAGGGSAVNIQDGGNSITVDGSVTVSATDLDIRNLVFADDKVDVSGSSVTVSATNLDIRDLTSVSDSVSAVQSGTWNINNVSGTVSLPTGAATSANQSTIITNTNRLDVVDFLDTPLLDASSTNIPGSGSSPLTVVASLAAAVKKIQVLDTTGGFFGVYSDPAGTPVLEAIIGPGSDQTIEVQLTASAVIGLRSMTTSAITTGNVAINFIG